MCPCTRPRRAAAILAQAPRALLCECTHAVCPTCPNAPGDGVTVPPRPCKPHTRPARPWSRVCVATARGAVDARRARLALPAGDHLRHHARLLAQRRRAGLTLAPTLNPDPDPVLNPNPDPRALTPTLTQTVSPTLTPAALTLRLDVALQNAPHGWRVSVLCQLVPGLLLTLGARARTHTAAYSAVMGCTHTAA
eukprot:1822624-Prymnesium_polylepis.1